MKFTLLAIALLGVSGARAQSPFDTLFTHYTIQHPVLKAVDVHVTKDKSGKKKPLLLYLDGSGNFPIYSVNKDGQYSNSVPLRIRKYQKDYYIALISKPGVPFTDSIKVDPSGRRYYPETEDYYSRYSFDWRAQAASEAFELLMKKMPIDTDRIIVMGYSEGSQIAPAVAVMNKHVTHAVCMVGNALNHLYDFLLDARLSVAQGERSPEEAQAIVDSL
jgi:predicted esterase